MHKRILVAAGTSVLAFALVYSVLSPLLTSIMNEFGVTNTLGGLTGAFLTVGFFVSALGGGYLADLVGMRALMFGGCLLLALGTLACGLAPVYWVLAVGMLMTGLGSGAVETVSSALINAVFLEKSAPALNLVQALFGLGALSGPVLAAAILHADSGIHWRWGFLICAAIAFVAASVQLILPKRVKNNSSLELSVVRKALIDKRFLLTCFALSLYVGGEGGLAVWACAFVERVHDVPKAEAALTSSLFWGGILLGRLAYQQLTQRTRLTSLLQVSGLLGTACIVAGLLVPNAIFSMALIGLSGFVLGGIWPTIVALGGQWFETYGATGTGIMIALGGAGALVSPPIIGVISDLSGNLQLALLADAPAFVVLALIMRWLARTQPVLPGKPSSCSL